MLRTMLKSTIHRATVTQADPHHVGSVTVDPELLGAADLLAGEQVTIVDVSTGARLETYVIAGDRGSGTVGVNGAAARLVQPGDTVSLLSYVLMDSAQAAAHRPRVVHVDEANKVVDAGLESGAGRPESATETAPAETADAAMLDALLQPES